MFSASAVTVLPIMVSLVLGLQNGRKTGTFCVGCLLLTIFAILLAGSRGGFSPWCAPAIADARFASPRKFVVSQLFIVAYSSLLRYRRWIA